MRRFAILCAALAGVVTTAQQLPPAVPEIGAVRPIEPSANPLPPESATASITRFTFFAYGDHRCSCTADAPAEDQTAHAAVVEAMLQRIVSRAATDSPIRFVLSSGDATFRGQNAERWNDAYIPIVERITKAVGVPYFLSVGNHDVSGMPPGDPGRAVGLHHTLSAVSKLIPPEGSPRRLNGYPTYAFGFGNSFFIAFDSNIAADPIQLAWVTDQLEHLDRNRYRNVFAFFHHPAFSAGPHNGAQPPTADGQKPPDRVEPSTLAIRTLYAPLFRKYHVRMTIAGHDHLFDHWVEHYVDDEGRNFRRDDVVTGGGGAPIYVYSGEPDVQSYVKGAIDQHVIVDHLAKPGPQVADNPHHFLVIDVDGEKLSLEIVAVGGRIAPYNGRSRSDLDR
jgi:calcineurin-like phosphoesterase family protein